MAQQPCMWNPYFGTDAPYYCHLGPIPNYEYKISGVSVGVPMGVSVGVAMGVAVGVAMGVSVGVAMGVSVGVAATVTCG